MKNSVVKQAVKDENKPDGEERWDHVREREGHSIDLLRKSIDHSIIYTLSIVLVGVIFVILFKKYISVDETTIRTIRVTSILVIAWSVIFRLGYIGGSWGGNSIPEQMKTYVFKFFYFIGVVGIVVSMYLK